MIRSSIKSVLIGMTLFALGGCASEGDYADEFDAEEIEDVGSADQAYNESTCRTVTPNKTWSVKYENYEILTADPPYGVTDCPDQAVFAFTNTRGIKYDILPEVSGIFEQQNSDAMQRLHHGSSLPLSHE